MTVIINKALEQEQRAFCEARECECLPATADSKLGYAMETEGRLPINGLRHPPQSDTNGWYVWCGDEMSSGPDFFSPLHTRHLIEKCPEVSKFLGLPPGYRFLIANDYIDLWYDSSLLDV
jgi:hypothetical protein